MIQSNELRTGSYRLVNNEMKRCCIKNEDDKAETTFVRLEHNDECEYESVSPKRLGAVPLTEALLTQLGFTFHSYYKTWQHPKPQRTATVDLTPEFAAVDFTRHKLVKHVHYLHLLQNLFFHHSEKRASVHFVNTSSSIVSQHFKSFL